MNVEDLKNLFNSNVLYLCISQGGCPLKVALNHLLLFFMETSKLGENIQTSHRSYELFIQDELS